MSAQKQQHGAYPYTKLWRRRASVLAWLSPAEYNAVIRATRTVLRRKWWYWICHCLQILNIIFALIMVLCTTVFVILRSGIPIVLWATMVLLEAIVLVVLWFTINQVFEKQCDLVRTHILVQHLADHGKRMRDCLNCGYELYGTAAQATCCPECGAAIAPLKSEHPPNAQPPETD